MMRDHLEQGPLEAGEDVNPEDVSPASEAAEVSPTGLEQSLEPTSPPPAAPIAETASAPNGERAPNGEHVLSPGSTCGSLRSASTSDPTKRRRKRRSEHSRSRSHEEEPALETSDTRDVLVADA